MRSHPLPSFRRSCIALLSLAVLGWGVLLSAPALAADTTPAQLLQHWSQQAGAPGDAQRGRSFFQATHGGAWSCASCHTANPLQRGEHAKTGKPIEPLAPAANPEVLRSMAQVDKWFRRNCRDVLSRECSAGEKADVLAYLVGLR